MAAGLLFLDFHKYCTTNLKLINDEADRLVVKELTQSKIMCSTATPKEIATLLRVYRALKVEENEREREQREAKRARKPRHEKQADEQT